MNYIPNTEWPEDTKRRHAFNAGKGAWFEGSTNPYEFSMNPDLWECWEAGYEAAEAGHVIE